ncbi:MAG: hypothetical protein FWE78_01345 [Methanimicrococcus sp.]|nr:hypothetical protein [Methanimicrococcus sp.]
MVWRHGGYGVSSKDIFVFKDIPVIFFYIIALLKWHRATAKFLYYHFYLIGMHIPTILSLMEVSETTQ